MQTPQEVHLLRSIIALIASIVIISFTYIRQKSRDAQRQTDLSLVAGAIENYYADNGYYPTPDTTHILPPVQQPEPSYSKDDYLGVLGILSSGNYLERCPRDPLDPDQSSCNNSQPSEVGYRYVCWGNSADDTQCRSYQILTNTEVEENSNYTSGTAKAFSVCNNSTLYFDRCPLILAPVNHPPIADAGPDQTVNEGDSVGLSGSASDPDGDPLTHGWSQIVGPPVTLAGATTLTPSFTAPEVLTDTVLTFELMGRRRSWWYSYRCG